MLLYIIMIVTYIIWGWGNAYDIITHDKCDLGGTRR